MSSSTKQPPPEKLTIAQAVAYMKKTHRLTVTTKTVYNWTQRGLGDETLSSRLINNPVKTHKHRKIKVTTSKWIDEFLTRTGVLHAK